jgi:hypothetical protein
VGDVGGAVRGNLSSSSGGYLGDDGLDPWSTAASRTWERRAMTVGSWAPGHPCGCTPGRRRGSRTAILVRAWLTRVAGSGLAVQEPARGRLRRWWKGRCMKVGGRESAAAGALALCKRVEIGSCETGS